MTSEWKIEISVNMHKNDLFFSSKNLLYGIYEIVIFAKISMIFTKAELNY